MVKQTKKLSTKTTVAQINATDKFPITDANGVVSLVTLATIKAAIMDGASLNAMYDGVFIQSSGEIADGVVVVEGGKCLVVAPTESASKLAWSSAAISGGGTTTTDRVTAINDWNGKTNTAQQIAHSTSSAVTNTASYAPGFCNFYSRANANGKGLTAGKWWLPSLGEMMMIYANMTKINYALSLINGATQLVEDAYWTSTEGSATYAWRLFLGGGYASINTKASDTHRVRAVSAFIA